jgi:CheY-like chemotaxis protein
LQPVDSVDDLASIEPTPQGGPTVLMIHDPDGAGHVYGEYLDFCGFRVLAAKDAADALACAEAERPALILVDLAGDGLEALRRLKLLPATAAIPVVALGPVLANAAALAREAGADVFLPKPCLPSQIARAIGALLISRRSAGR